MGKGVDMDVLRIPAIELQASDRIWHMGQWFVVWSVEALEPPLIRVTGEAANYQSVLILDSRLEIKAVMREIGELD